MILGRQIINLFTHWDYQTFSASPWTIPYVETTGFLSSYMARRNNNVLTYANDLSESNEFTVYLSLRFPQSEDMYPIVFVKDFPHIYNVFFRSRRLLSLCFSASSKLKCQCESNFMHWKNQNISQNFPYVILYYRCSQSSKFTYLVHRGMCYV